ncbi:hypothetical protein F5148DRAFT_654200 [Russula earlei]|uniref:Uncharacterized protein n=1 Tax=Russula earlei TaxID=71964 RepID=A0ACC0UMI3_9AGAM|nr:hypothetical protein F5148DRAFT_654200 [Russula earlei]
MGSNVPQLLSWVRHPHRSLKGVTLQRQRTSAHAPYVNANVGPICFAQSVPEDPDALPILTPSNGHLSEASPKLTTQLVDVSCPESEHDLYQSPEKPNSFASGTPIVVGESTDPLPFGRYIATAAPLLPVPSPPPALAIDFPSLHQNNQHTQDLITGLHGTDAHAAPWWAQSAWVPPTPPAPLPVPLRTPSISRRSQSPELLVHVNEQDGTVKFATDTLAANATLRSESGREHSPNSLPHVPPVDFNELFDLASQFRHLLDLPPVVTPPSLSALPEEMPNGSRAESVEVEEVSAPTELASTQVDDAGTPLSPVALLSKPKTPGPGVFDSISPGRLLSQLLDSSYTASVSSPVDKKKCVDDEDAPLRASFIADNNIPDGQIFPPGAEFVKSWRMRNDGPGPWSADTELVFVAGDKLTIDKSERVKVGSVPPGEEVDVWTGEMKAPDVPGKYISYWRLCDHKGRRFGHSIWIDICVAELRKVPTPEEGCSSLASSSVVMPHSAPSNPSIPIPSHDESTTAPLLSDASSISLIDVPTDDDDDDDDSEVYEDSRSHFGSTPGNGLVLSPDVEYVVLSDSSDGM